MAPIDKAHKPTNSYSSSIANMSLSYAVSEIFSIKYYRDHEMWIMGRSRSIKMAPIDIDHIRLRLLVCHYKREEYGSSVQEFKQNAAGIPRMYLECNANVPSVSRIWPEYFPIGYKIECFECCKTT